MINRLFFLSTYRRYIISLIILVLIGISSFLFGEKILEHYFSTIELKEAAKFYKAVGEIVWEEGSSVNIDEISNYLETDEYVQAVNKFARVSGVLCDGVNNVDYVFSAPDEADSFGYSSSHDIIVVGTYDGCDSDRRDCAYFFKVKEVLSGYEEYVLSDKEIAFANYGDKGRLDKSLETGKDYVIRGHYSTYAESGSVQLIVEGRFGGKAPKYSLFELKPLVEEGPFFVEAASLSEYDKEIENDIFLMNENRKAVDIRAYEDISAANFLQGDNHTFYLEEGIWPTVEDEKNLCVISSQMAKERGISLNDTIKLSLRDTYIDYDSCYCGIREKSEYEGVSKEEVELKVAGIFSENAEMAGYSNSIYVSAQVIPKSFRTQPSLPIYQSTVIYAAGDSKSFEITGSTTNVSRMAGTFVLKKNEDIDAFCKDFEEEFSAKGILAIFYENGYDNFKEVSANIIKDDISNLRIYGAILLFIYVVSVELYGLSLRKEAGLLRVFGVSKKKCFSGFVMPVATCGIVAIIAGTFTASFRTVKNTARLDSFGIQSSAVGADHHTALVVCGIILGLSVLLLTIIFIGAYHTVNTPLINVLKKVPNKRGPKEKTSPTTTANRGKNTSLWNLALTNHIRSKDGWIWVAIIIGLCIVCNSFLPTVIRSQKNKLDNLYKSITIQVDATKVDNYYIDVKEERGFVTAKIAKELEEKCCFENFKYSAELSVFDLYEIDDSTGYINSGDNHTTINTPIEATTDLDAMLQKDGVEEIEWREGWNRERFESSSAGECPVLVPNFFNTSLWTTNPTKVAVYYEKGKEKKIEQFEIVGTYSGKMSYMYTSLTTLDELLGDDLMYYEISFSVKKEFNTELERIKEEANEILSGQERAKLLFWDQEFESSIDRIKSVIGILEKLSLIMKYVSILLVGVLALLITYLRRKDGLLLLAIGNSAPVGRVLALIQLGLTVLAGAVSGVLLSLAINGVYNRGLAKEDLHNTVEPAGIYILISLIVGVIITHVYINKKEIRTLRAKE